MSGGWPVSQEFSNPQSVNTTTANSAAGVLTITTTSNNTRNAYTQLIASTVGDATWMDMEFGPSNASINTNLVVDVAIGSGGNEKIICNNLSNNINGAISFTRVKYNFPVNIPSGSRIAARFAMSSSTTTTTNITLVVNAALYEGGVIMSEGFAGVDSVGQANSIGTTIFTTSTANRIGPYSQLTAATTQDYAGFVVGMDTPQGSGLNRLVDIAVGGGGVEQVILPRWHSQNTQGQFVSTTPPIMVPIPSGTRVAARMQSAGATDQVNITLYGIYQ